MSHSKTQQHRADPTRLKILKAATKLFAKHGYSGTAVGKIAEKAGVNHSLIFFHFTNKQTLWQTVKESIGDQDFVIPPPLVNQDFRSYLEMMMRQLFQAFYKNPDLMMILNWQRLEARKQPIGVGRNSRTETLINTIQQYQRQGEICPDIPPEFVLNLILTNAGSPDLLNNALLRKNKEQYMEFCIAAIYKAVTL